MQILYFDKDKNTITEYDTFTEQKYFKFILRHCPQEINRGMEDTWELADSDSGNIISESDFKKIDGATTYNHHWICCSWGYDCSNKLLFIYNQPIDI